VFQRTGLIGWSKSRPDRLSGVARRQTAAGAAVTMSPFVLSTIATDLAALRLGNRERGQRLVEIVHERVPLVRRDAKAAMTVDHRSARIALGPPAAQHSISVT
jgi:phage terminase large subunit-like protein